MKRLLLLALLLPCPLIAQVNDDVSPDGLVDNIIPANEDDTDKSESIENYSELLSHAIDLNSVDRERLRVLNVLTDEQIENLISHRELNGKLLSLYELQTIDGFDLNTINRIKGMVTVNDPSARINRDIISRIRSDSENYFLLRYDQTLQRKKGFTSAASDNHRFIGTPERIVWRFRSFRSGDFSFGLTGEKDPGERLTWKPSNRQYGFDHLAMHLQLQNKGIIKNIVVGDFQAQFGQGLIWGGGIGFGKGAETVVNTRRPNVGFLPYTSAYEGGNLRGVASTIELTPHLSISTAISRNRRDASIQGEGEEESASSLQSTGLHRNASELQKRKTVGETISGAVIQYQRNQLTAGLNFQDVRFDSPVIPAERLYNYHSFKGSTNRNSGLFLNFSHNNFTFFNEVASTWQGGTAYSHGVLISLSNRFDVSAAFRKFGRNYQSFYANAFGESSKPQNETGFYWGFRYKLPKRLQYSGYLDLFRFPGLRYRVYTPSTGYEWLSRLQWQPSKTTTAFIQIRRESKYRNVSAESTLYTPDHYLKTNFWISLDYQPYPGLRMKTRFQGSTFKLGEQKTSGHAMLQDIAYRTGNVAISVRYALFDTDDFDNRQYVFENDVWLSFSMPAYYGIGVRRYAMIQYKLNRTYTIWLRYSNTRYLQREKIGSGPDEIVGNRQNDIKFELRIKF